jgi:murein endopeptidase
MATKTRKKVTSKGVHSSVKKSTTRLVKKDRTFLEKIENISKAWKKFKNPWITIKNPNKSETNRMFIRVRTNDYWGNPKIVKEMKDQ